ncbi:hypothetical protein C3B59_17380 [Cryobacterium zongtaii]|uniref:Uncharacterized protein n=1 Tax=Cryobacterium zongtaii TaxID=1259217 RepID=A0A2S3Z652_9MICO|nr:hypothetical protein C3B59_17380 [Cryobacterium zongtaii]
MLREAIRARTTAVIKHLGPDAPALALELETRRYTANSARTADPSRDLKERTMLLHTLRLLATATELMPERRRRAARYLELAQAMPGIRCAWAGHGEPPPIGWETEAAIEPSASPAGWSAPRRHAIELPFSGRRERHGLGLPVEIGRHLGSSDLRSIDRSFQRYLATEMMRAAFPYGLADKRSRATMAFAVGLVWESMLGAHPGGASSDRAPDEYLLTDIGVATAWNELFAVLWRSEHGVGRFDLIRAGYGLQARLLPQLGNGFQDAWHPALADRAFGMRSGENSPSTAWLRELLPFDLARADEAFRINAAGAVDELRKRIYNPAFTGSLDEFVTEIKARTLRAFHQALLKNEQMGGYRAPTGGPNDDITLRSVNEQVRGRRQHAIDQVTSGASSRQAARTVIDGEQIGPRGVTDTSTKARAHTWAVDYLRAIRTVEKFWWVLNRRAGLPEVPAEHVLGASLHLSFLDWLERSVEQNERRSAIVIARITADLAEGRVPNDEPPLSFEEWLRHERYHYPGPRSQSILLWSEAQTGLMSERRRLRERKALTAYLDAILADETGVWEPVATRWSHGKHNGSYLLPTLAGIVEAEYRGWKRRTRER